MSAGCERCAGTGFEIVSREGREFAQPCGCRRVGSAASDPLAASRIPPRYEHCTLTNFENFTPSLSAAQEKCLRYVAGYPYLGPTDEGLGLLFTGDSGVGKSHLAVAVLKELVAGKGVRASFWDFHELIREIRNCYNEETRITELEVLTPVVEVDVLLLDDLGAWKMTEWMLDTLFFILNSRYLAKRSTLITTNFPDASPEVAARSDHPRRKEYLVERVGVPLRSRIMEMCLVLPMHGQDYRQVRQTGHQTVVGGRPAPR